MHDLSVLHLFDLIHGPVAEEGGGVDCQHVLAPGASTEAPGFLHGHSLFETGNALGSEELRRHVRSVEEALGLIRAERDDGHGDDAPGDLAIVFLRVGDGEAHRRRGEVDVRDVDRAVRPGEVECFIHVLDAEGVEYVLDLGDLRHGRVLGEVEAETRLHELREPFGKFFAQKSLQSAAYATELCIIKRTFCQSCLSRKE